MSGGLREAAAKALARLSAADAPTPKRALGIERITVDVVVDGRPEMVSFALRAGELTWSSTGDKDGVHVAEALAWLADGAAPATLDAEVAVDVGAPTMRSRDASVPVPSGDLRSSAPPADSARARLADALEDVVTVIVRAGAGAASSPSVSESLERLRKEAPLPAPAGLARWFGRLKLALEGTDVSLVARLLDGASRLAADLRGDRPSRKARQRVVAWMGASGELSLAERVSDRTLVELAREWLPSSERGGLERRYLADLHNGEIFREERSRTSATASVGPCPRVVRVGLAEVEDGAPRRIRPMQYVVGLDVTEEDLSRVEANGYRRFAALADRYKEQVRAHPGQAEPFAVVVPKRWEDGEDPVSFDDEGEPLPFARADDPAAVDLLRRLVPTGKPRWIAGRLVDVEGTLMMVPCAVAVPEGEGTRLHRIR